MKTEIFSLLTLSALVPNYAFVHVHQPQVKFASSSSSSGTHTQLQMATVPVSADSTVGIVGRGFVSVLSAKLAAKAGYDTWMLLPPGQKQIVEDLIDDDTLGNLEMVESTDSDRVDSRLAESDAFLIAVDDDSTMDESVLNYVLNPEVTKAKRVVAMSRNLNGKDMGFFVKASKISANREVWDNDKSKKAAYEGFEKVIQRQTKAIGAEYTIVRAGTLKGGGCGDEPVLSQFLSKKFYDMTKKDIITWQLLFDCSVRGVKLVKGDVLPGPGAKAVFTATGTEGGLPGDSGRCQIAEAMLQSLASEKAGNVDFGVGTEEAREPPTSEEWQKMFGDVL